MTETYKIEIPIYRITVHLFFGSEEDCKKAIIADGETELIAQQWASGKDEYEGSFSVEDDGYTLIWVRKLPESVGDYGSLIHEIEHCTFEILNSRGVKHSDDSDEAYAYLLGWLYEEIENFIQDEKERRIHI